MQPDSSKLSTSFLKNDWERGENHERGKAIAGNSGSRPSTKLATPTPWMLAAPEPASPSPTRINFSSKRMGDAFAAAKKGISRVTAHKKARVQLYLQPPQPRPPLPRLQVYQLPPSLLSPYSLIAHLRLKNRRTLRSQR